MFGWFCAWRAYRRMLAGPHYRDHILALKSATPMALPPVREIRAVAAPLPVPKKRKKRRAKRSQPRVLSMPRTGTV